MGFDINSNLKNITEKIRKSKKVKKSEISKKIKDIFEKGKEINKRYYNKKNYDKISKIYDIIHVLLTIFFIYVLYRLTKITSNVIFENFSSQLKHNIFMTFVFLCIIIFVFEHLKYYFCKRQNHDRKLWASFTIYIMLFTLALGHVYIDFEFNNTEINLPLQDYTNHSEWGIVNGNISCVTNDGKVLKYGQLIICTTQPELYNGSEEVTYRYLNGSEIREKLKYGIKFRTPENTKEIEFQLEGYDINNKYHSFIVSKRINFISPDDEDMYEGRLITLYIWLFGAMFLIPTMMNNMKQLWEK